MVDKEREGERDREKEEGRGKGWFKKWWNSNLNLNQ